MQGSFFNKGCGAIVPLLWDYVAGTLEASSPEAARVEEHIARCERCRAQTDSFRKAAEALNAHAATPAGGMPERPGDWNAVRARIVAAQASPSTGDSKVSKPRFGAGVGMRPVLVGGLALTFGVAACALGGFCLQSQNNRTPYIEDQEASPNPPGVATGAATDTNTSVRIAASKLYSSVPPVEMSVNSSWMDGSALVSGPLVVAIQNHTGRAINADLIVDRGIDSNVRRSYIRHISLSADAKVHRYFSYPAWGGGNTSLLVTLAGGRAFPVQTANLWNRDINSDSVNLGLVGDQFGALQPVKNVAKDPYYRKKIRIDSDPLPNLQYATYYAKPNDAPDRAIGYQDMTALVIGQGAEKLNAEQRKAIRTWIMGGGSAILLPSVDADLASTLAGGSEPEALERITGVPEGKGKRWQLGLGTVVAIDRDLTERAYRLRPDLPFIWKALVKRAAPIMPASALRGSASDASLEKWGNLEAGTSKDDPFSIALPPLQTVVYLFVGYFVLAVPVTFVVLRRTRRMNLAWVTGPTLAVLFGGSIYAFTSDLYAAHMSRRTAGVLVAVAGEPKAQFQGYTEMYFPKGGSYSLGIPGATSVEMSASGYYGYGGGDTMTVRSLNTIETDKGLTAPAMSVGNLSFRRIYHSQDVDLGEGIQSDLHFTAEGRIVGTIRNGTDKTLDNAVIVLPAKAVGQKSNSRLEYQVKLGALAPGLTKVDQRVAWEGMYALNRLRSDSGYRYGRYLDEQIVDPETSLPILVANVSGESFGPNMGDWSANSRETVKVAVVLPAVHEGSDQTGVAAVASAKEVLQ